MIRNAFLFLLVFASTLFAQSLPDEVTVLEGDGFHWTRQASEMQTEFRKYQGDALATQVILGPDAKMIDVDGHTFFLVDRWAYNMFLQRVWFDSRMDFSSGTVFYGGFTNQKYLQVDANIGLLKPVGNPPWIGPHSLEFEMVGDVALTHMFTPSRTVQPFLFDPVRGFWQLDAVAGTPGEATIRKEGDKVIFTLWGKDYEVPQ